MERPLRVALFALVAACHAELADPGRGTGDAGTDAQAQSDAVDAPIDARPCDGGQARAPDPSTGSCFVYFTGPLPYDSAEAACTAMTARLAVIKSAPTNTVVRSLIALTDAYIGATDRTTEGTFLWLDNAADPLGAYTNWRAGEPNNGNGGNEDCGIIEGDQNGTWDDRPCAGVGYAYVCQF